MNYDFKMMLGVSLLVLSLGITASAIVWCSLSADREAMRNGYVEQALPGTQKTIWVKP
jgi:hypothetical protein